MIAALLLGRKGSTGLPGKNLLDLRGHPLAWYPMTAAAKAPSIDRAYLSTNDEQLVALAQTVGLEIIERPAHLCTADALGEDAFRHGYDVICQRAPTPPEIMVLMFCNAPNITSATIETAIQTLRAHPDYDSVVTVSRFNMFSPVRARRINAAGCLEPFVALDKLGVNAINCDRNCQGDVWFTDCGVTVVWSRVLLDMAHGQLPQRWMGQRIYALKQDGGMDVDAAWQVPVLAWWLEQFGDQQPGAR